MIDNKDKTKQPLCSTLPDNVGLTLKAVENGRNNKYDFQDKLIEDF